MAMVDSVTPDAAARRKRRRGGADRRFELGPHSALFRRGAVGNLNGNTAEAKYLRTVERAILDHLGGADRTTVPQRLYAARLAKIALRLELFDRKLIEDGTLTDHDGKVYSALHSAFRLMLRDLLGLKGAILDRSPTAPHLAALTAKQREKAT